MASSDPQFDNVPISLTTPRSEGVFWAVLASLAIALPTLIAFNVPPSATFFNQAAAFVGWGGFLLVLGTSIPRRQWPRSSGSVALLAALAILLLASLAASIWLAFPWSLSLSSAGTIASAMLAMAMGASARRSDLGDRAFTAVCVGLVVAGAACSVIGLIQVFAPNVADGDWIAISALAGRATGNLRQPNHLSSVLLWSIVAAVWLGERRVLDRRLGATLVLVFVWGVMLTASRTGAIGVVTLAAWAALDRRLSRSSRWLLLATPLAYALLYWVTNGLLHAAQAVGADARFSGGGLFQSNSRVGVWLNALSLIKMHPWMGVGFGEFNFAWSLTPFPGRPPEFFDHAHNIVLQLAAELGVPLTLLVFALILFAAIQALRNALADGRALPATSRLRGPSIAPESAASGSMQRAAFVMVLMAGMHSMLEYPLWYSYFLLPTAFVFGLCLERPAVRARRSYEDGDDDGITRPYVLAALLLMLGAALAIYDYTRVVVIFAPPGDAGPLAQRIEGGRRSILFAHHGDYAAATNTDRPGEVMSAFTRAPHYLLDARLMMAWANALDANGETDKARYVAARLKEFRNEQTEEFFAPCRDASPSAPASAASAAALPFQCLAPTKALTYKDFR